MDFSIVIPALNEETKIARDIQNCVLFLQEHHLTGEVIVVDDGSDDRTQQIAKKVAGQFSPVVKVVSLQKHTGKGKAVKTGVGLSQGDYVMFVDSGSCVPMDYALKGRELIESGRCEVANGSRKMKQSVVARPHPRLRRIISRTIRHLLILWIGLPSRFTDTQCGFKIYKGDIARELYGDCLKNGFLFDVEIIMRALKKGYRVVEFPVKWTADLDSRLSPVKHLVGIVQELIELARIVKAL